ncbi:MAG: uncharacterized protein QOG01_2739 [Pseudonocardiales bacterium]|nr:uncharacterized protein [Pseudonocardiales bacterium]
MSVERLELVSWRRATAALYARVRASANPADGHAVWRAGRDELFRSHPQSPLPADDPLRTTGLPYWPYDPARRFTCSLLETAPAELGVPTSTDGTIHMHRIGSVRLPAPVNATLDVWWLDQYAGGLFLPLRDGTAGRESYGGGRYLLDTAKSADLGGDGDTIVVDLNFAYHPSCRYNPRWECPLAPDGNRIDAAIRAGERL